MTLDKWEEHCNAIFTKFDYSQEDVDWQPYNIERLIKEMREEANELEELTRVYEEENKRG